jgi:NADPH2:quinone reductase
MKALYFTQHGEIDVIRYGDVPDAAPGRGEGIVRVRACAINHLDIWIRRGWPVNTTNQVYGTASFSVGFMHTWDQQR